MFSRLVIIGVGLLGGSIGLAAKKHGLAQTVTGVGRTEKTLETAFRNGIIDEYYLLQESVPPPAHDDQTLVVVCTPVADIIRNVFAAIRHFGHSGRLLITDVGSTKTKQVQEISDTRFIGSHPIAGSERSGPDAADAELFQNRLTVLTPTKFHSADNINLLRRFWQTLGAHVIEMDAVKHDEILAVTSHLPHVLSVILTRMVREEERPLTGTGFAGMTRLAAGSPEIWRDILLDNSGHVLNALHRFDIQLREFINVLQSKDIETIERLLHEAKSIVEK
ncbi:MAG: prephenate dehydrogenase/arogenate dehydrogenase family protein [Planctomycetaceae bacterium]|jgi:prephenate dehydrogenase|nr:prephenate dehydrogenase/arogenate dehydrogenase family protein [Planctomycetaceae bacterium]